MLSNVRKVELHNDAAELLNQYREKQTDLDKVADAIHYLSFLESNDAQLMSAVIHLGPQQGHPEAIRFLIAMSAMSKWCIEKFSELLAEVGLSASEEKVFNASLARIEHLDDITRRALRLLVKIGDGEFERPVTNAIGMVSMKRGERTAEDVAADLTQQMQMQIAPDEVPRCKAPASSAFGIGVSGLKH